jgi:PAS domain S-box-containing protein
MVFTPGSSLEPESHDPARVLLDSSPIAAVITNPAGELLFANRRTYEIMGVAYGAPLPVGVELYVNPRRFGELVRKFAANRTLVDEEVQYQLPDGSTIWCLVNWQNIEYDQQPALVVWSYDITHQKAVETAIEHARDMAEAASRTKAEFLANMSHELRTPLNAIIGYSQILQEDIEEAGLEGPVSDLKRVEAAGKHLLGLINDMLDISKIDAGKMEVFLEPVNLPRLFEEVHALTLPLALKNSNQLAFHIVDNLPTIRADYTKLKQSLLNLISNACKFTQNGQVRVEAQVSGDNVRFEVSDTGIGMNEAQRGRLFQPFSQADASTTRQFGGTGLGLAITQRFCRMMGGEVSVRSASGEGSTFSIILPREFHESSEKPGLTILPDGPKIDEASSRILLVDDDPEIHHLLGTMLEREGYEIDHAFSGEEALVCIMKQRPFVVLLDVMMPAMDGWTTLGRLKADPDFEHIPVVIVSLLNERPMGMSLGAAEVVSKPVDRSQLVNLVRTFSGTHRVKVLVVVQNRDERAEICKALPTRDFDAIEAESSAEAESKLTTLPPNSVILIDGAIPATQVSELLTRISTEAARKHIKVIVQTAQNAGLIDADLIRDSGAILLALGQNRQAALLELLNSFRR